MKKNRGFTLIELLAVIVILAIIALISVPVIMNIINKANKSAFKDTAYGVISAGELYFAEHQLEPNGMLEDVTITLPDTTNKLQLKGEVPTGTIYITTEGKIAMAVHNNRYCVTKGIDDKDVTITEGYEECEMPKILVKNNIMSSYDTCIKTGVCHPGTEVDVEVNDLKSYKFFVVSDSGSELTLIMDRNIYPDGKSAKQNVRWVSEEDYNDDVNFGNFGNTDKGPITALNYLNTQTLDWTNIPPIANYKYDNNLDGTQYEYGYQKLEIIDGISKLTSQTGNLITEITGKSRARMLTFEEADNIVSSNDNKMPEWLYINLYGTGDNNTHGYWLSSNLRSNIYNARIVYSYGYLSVSNFNNGSSCGIRPVITLTK